MTSTSANDGARILIVDDEQAYASELQKVLERSGYAVDCAYDGQSALDYVHEHEPSLMILDINMEPLSGIQVLDRLRKGGFQTPVIMLTQLDDRDYLLGTSLKGGADDYLDKPFRSIEMLARIEALLRRSGRGRVPIEEASYLAAGSLLLDRLRRKVWLDKQEIKLTSLEFRLLEYLMINHTRTVTREVLLQNVWGGRSGVHDEPEPRTVDIHVSRIRTALGDDKSAPRFIETRTGYGYLFKLPVQATK
jgi:DNA-binding response OmpR family regulator